MVEDDLSKKPLGGLLGEDVAFVDRYTPSLLQSIRRDASRRAYLSDGHLPFGGEDLWTGYDFTWLDHRGKPSVATFKLSAPCTTPVLVESKSLKLYLSSFSQTRFANWAEVQTTLASDLQVAYQGPVIVELVPITHTEPATKFAGTSLDDLTIDVDVYTPDVGLLELGDADVSVHESVHTHLFRSVCPVTGQPDLAGVWISYRGRPVERASLLAYLISYRTHAAFHEACIEQIFVDLLNACRPEALTVYGRFQRRGGLDINPYRTTTSDAVPQLRLGRQ